MVPVGGPDRVAYDLLQAGRSSPACRTKTGQLQVKEFQHPRSGAMNPLRRFALCTAAGGLVLASAPAAAAVDFNPLATVSAVYNSNVFARPSDEPPFASRGTTQLGDFITRYLVGATADFTFAGDELSLIAQGSRFQFNRFDVLNHYESKYGGTFTWHAGLMLDGSLNFTQSRIMAPLADNLADVLEVQTDKVASGTFRLLFTPRWRLDLLPTWHDFESPLPLYPDFGLKESGGSASVNYLGIDKLTAGLREEYLNGSYHHIVAATRYHQITTDLTANYAVTGFSAFDGQLGYTTRNSSLVDSAGATGPLAGVGGALGKTTAFTGALGFKRALSVKTSISLRVFREVDSYVAGANSEIGTGGEAGIKWDPTLKLSLTLRYRMATQNIQGDVAISDFASRSDRVKHAEIGIDYKALYWLTIHPYALRDQRTSNFHDANYTANAVGVDFTAQLHPQKQ
jgi:hypothetical protein